MKITTILFLLILQVIIIQPLRSQTSYYVDSARGDDSFMGTSPQKAWKSVNKVNSAALNPGDSVLFKRGETWREGYLHPKSGNKTARVYYGSYGKGKLPLLLGSQNKNQVSDWKLDSMNIWVCTTRFSVDIGNIIFDNEHHAGEKKWSQKDLKAPDDYYYQEATGELKLYSEGNPALKHKVIECALRKWMVEIEDIKYVTFENLAFKYGGGQGFAGESSANLIIRKCELSWIGGGRLNDKEQVRFGNAIEFWRYATDNLVECNKIWEIYDTALTNQSLYEGLQKNIIYRNNLLWNCGMAAVEVWNQDPKGITKCIYFENNTCVNMGSGWGKRSALHTGSCFISFDNKSITDSVFIRNNIFVTPSRFFYFVSPESNFLHQTIDNNCYSAKSPADTFYYNYGNNHIVTLKDLDNFKNKTQDDRNSILASPQFVNPIRHNYRLRRNSPCRDSGTRVNNPYDFDGNIRPLGRNFDVGAFESK